MARDTSTVHTVLGDGAVFEGKLTFEGEIRIEGHFKGEIRTDDVLVVGKSAKVEAELRVGTVIVNGEIHGDIYADKSVELHQPARVFGNIHTPSLMIERGVIFEGQCKMQNLEAAKNAGGERAKGSDKAAGGAPNDGKPRPSA
ncbi:MAG: polymer-forming cytoskeletal protein [Deltaproteobacteria bacterium]|nr:MAG: polymer-forming cytoskeletal protein [Deltaproteobacteria bacterium]